MLNRGSRFAARDSRRTRWGGPPGCWLLDANLWLLASSCWLLAAHVIQGFSDSRIRGFGIRDSGL